MNLILEEIDRCFPSNERAPSKTMLVKFDGYDQFEKESAEDAFGGKSSKDVFEGIRKGKYVWRSVHLESWTVLEPEALRYYLPAYLKSLVLEFEDANPDVNFIDNVFFELREAIRMKGLNIFNKDQRKLLFNIGQHALSVIQNDDQGRFETGGEHIIENIEKGTEALGDQIAG